MQTRPVDTPTAVGEEPAAKDNSQSASVPAALSMLAEYDAVCERFYSTDLRNEFKAKDAQSELEAENRRLNAKWSGKLVSAELSVVFVKRNKVMLGAPAGRTWLEIGEVEKKDESIGQLSTITNKSMVETIQSLQGFIVGYGQVPAEFSVEEVKRWSHGDKVNVIVRIGESQIRFAGPYTAGTVHASWPEKKRETSEP